MLESNFKVIFPPFFVNIIAAVFTTVKLTRILCLKFYHWHRWSVFPYACLSIQSHTSIFILFFGVKGREKSLLFIDDCLPWFRNLSKNDPFLHNWNILLDIFYHCLYYDTMQLHWPYNLRILNLFPFSKLADTCDADSIGFRRLELSVVSCSSLILLALTINACHIVKKKNILSASFKFDCMLHFSPVLNKLVLESNSTSHLSFGICAEYWLRVC